MLSEADLWAGYFYPETYDAKAMQGILRNKFDERDPDVLSALEYGATARRQRQLMAGEAEVPRTYDAQHLRALHHHLFQDVYDWAGRYRTVPIYKGTPVGFADVKSGAVDRYLSDVHRLVKETPWARLDRDEFGERAATVFAYLNQAHPFREGNGRTSKVFMEHVAEQSSFTLDYDRVSPVQWNEASKWSGPDLHGYEPHPGDLVPVFRAISVERLAISQSAPESAPGLTHDLSAYRAAFPKPVAGATRSDPGTPAAGRPSKRPLQRPGQHYDAGRG